MAAQAGGRFHRGTSMCSKSPLIRGRMFTDRDDGSAPGVVLINEGLAKQFWPNSDPVGQRITIGKGVGPEFEEPPREIIGIVGDVRNQGLDNKPDPIMYIPVAQVKRWSDGAEQQHHSHHLGDPHQGRALLAEQRNSRRATHGERRVARCAYPIDGTSEGRIHCAHGLQYDAVDDFRGRRTAAGRDWYLWADGVLRPATDTGNWDSHRAGSERA